MSSCSSGGLGNRQANRMSRSTTPLLRYETSWQYLEVRQGAGFYRLRFRHEKECFWRSETRKGDQTDHGGSFLFVQLARWNLAKRKISSFVVFLDADHRFTSLEKTPPRGQGSAKTLRGMIGTAVAFVPPNALVVILLS